jgi:hypothetical protein
MSGTGRRRGEGEAVALREGPPAGASAAILLAVGAADLAVETLGSALRGVRGLLRRSDLGELAEQGQRDIRARGRLVLDRYAAVPEPPMEVLARHAAARRGDV